MYSNGQRKRFYNRSDWYIFAKLYKNKIHNDEDKLLHTDNKPSFR